MLSLNTSTTTAQSRADSKPVPDSRPRPEYELLRDEEDWSFLADRSRWTDVWDPVKFIPFDWPSVSYLSLGGEARQQYERFANEEWGSERPDGSGYLLQRYMFHADMRLGQRVRLFGQLKSGIEAGRAGGPRRPDEDRFDVHQGYAEMSIGPRPDPRRVSLRAGRQEFQFGSGRLVSVREGPNVRQSFDAFRAIVRHDPWRVDVFVSRPVITTPGTLDDRRDDNRGLWGVYVVRSTSASERGFDVYYLGYTRRDARFDQGTARERRHSTGVRLWGQALGFDYNAEAIAQWGTFGASRIRAWTFASDTGYRIHLPGNPRVGLRADVTSGDRNRTDDTLGTFNPLFPRGAYFGLIAPTGPLNHTDLHPSIAFALQKGWSVSASWLFFWRTQRDDGLYSVPGNLLRSAEGTHAHFVGQSPGIEIKWQATPHISFTADLSTFSAGAFLKESPPGRMITYFAVWTTYKF
jgi:Alginate export